MTLNWQAIIMQVIAAVIAGVVLAIIQGAFHKWKSGTY
tara:strand:- start:911 stop:1024 length:114 start_codon:yes stop_codon:yes gene_type:complete